MKKLGVVLGFLACVMFVGSVMAAEPGRLVKGRYVMSSVELPLGAFQYDTGGPLTGSTDPTLEEDDAIPCISWADGETTPAQQSFMVPGDYLGDGRFKIFCTESSSTTPNQLDFDVYVNSYAAAADSSATGQTPVALDQTTTTGSWVTLIPATDFDSLEAYDIVTLRMWRDDTAIGDGDLEAKNAVFLYTPIGD